MAEIPVISITRDNDMESDCNDDYDDYNGISNSHTDIEDVDSDPDIQRCKSPNKMLKVKRRTSKAKNVCDEATDIEDYNDTDSDGDDDDEPSKKYENTFSLSEFLDQGCSEETMNPHESISGKTGTRRRSTALWWVDDDIGEDGGGITDFENIETSDDEQNPMDDTSKCMETNCSIYLPEEMNKISIQDSVTNRKKFSMSSVSSDSDENDTPKLLQIKKLNCEGSDVENIYITDDDAGGSKNCSPMMCNPIVTEEIMAASTDTDTDEKSIPKSPTYPEINIVFGNTGNKANRRRKTKLVKNTLQITETDDCGHTDVENLNSSDEEDTSKNSLLIPIAFVKSPNLPVTDVEDFDDPDDDLETDAQYLKDIKMPSPVRELILTKESTMGTPISKVMPMSSSMYLGISESYIDKGLTDTEEMSGKEEDLVNYYSDQYTIDSIPTEIDGGFTINSETLKPFQDRLNPVTDIEPLTDTEYLNLDNSGTNLRRRKTKTKNTSYKGKKFLDTNTHYEKPTTDLEDLYISDDGENNVKAPIPTSISLQLPVRDDGFKTDVEELSDDDDDGVEDVPLLKEIDPSILMQESFFSTITSRDNCSRTKRQTKYSKFNVPIIMRKTSVTDAQGTTDVEEIISDTDDHICIDSYSRAGTVTPIEVQQALNESGNSTVIDKNTSHFDLSNEACHIKGHKHYQDVATDVEFLDEDQDARGSTESTTNFLYFLFFIN